MHQYELHCKVIRIMISLVPIQTRNKILVLFTFYRVKNALILAFQMLANPPSLLGATPLTDISRDQQRE
jgi:hypothetical protein